MSAGQAFSALAVALVVLMGLVQLVRLTQSRRYQHRLFVDSVRRYCNYVQERPTVVFCYLLGVVIFCVISFIVYDQTRVVLYYNLGITYLLIASVLAVLYMALYHRKVHRDANILNRWSDGSRLEFCAFSSDISQTPNTLYLVQRSADGRAEHLQYDLVAKRQCEKDSAEPPEEYRVYCYHWLEHKSGKKIVATWMTGSKAWRTFDRDYWSPAEASLYGWRWTSPIRPENPHG